MMEFQWNKGLFIRWIMVCISRRIWNIQYRKTILHSHGVFDRFEKNEKLLWKPYTCHSQYILQGFQYYLKLLTLIKLFSYILHAQGGKNIYPEGIYSKHIKTNFLLVHYLLQLWIKICLNNIENSLAFDSAIFVQWRICFTEA